MLISTEDTRTFNTDIRLAATLAACSTTSPDVVSRQDAQRLANVQDATVLAVRPVRVDGSQSGGGALAGGVVGGVAGAYVLTSIDGSVVKPFVLAYLVAMGIYLLVRGLMSTPQHGRAKIVAPIGLIGGFLDAVGGGGWGPMVTSNLLVQGVEPRRVVGTVNSVEFFLTLTVSAAFIYHLGLRDFATATLGLLIGGVAAAPIGAILAKRIPTRALLILVGAVLTVTSTYGFIVAVLM